MIHFLFSVILMLLAGAYGWGMRGSAIGGEKGAMLPGALIGVILAFSTGIVSVQQNLIYYAALGAVGMYFGGTEPDAQTMGFILHGRPAPNYKKGLVGLMLKGSLWFGIFAAVFGVGYSVKAGLLRCKAYEFAILIAAVIAARLLGYVLLNKPFNREEGIRPKIYFSETSREEWGGLLFTLLAFLVFAFVKGNSFTLWFVLAGVFGGGIGWAIAINLYWFGAVPQANGKQLFPRLNRLGVFEGWKLMEMTLGSFGGICLLIAFAALNQVNGLHSASFDFAMLFNYSNKTALGDFLKSQTAAVILVGVWLAYLIQYTVVVLTNHKTERYEIITDSVNRGILVYFPLLMLLVGNKYAAAFVAITAMIWVLTEQMALERYLGQGRCAVLSVILFVLSVASAVYCIILDKEISFLIPWLFYLVGYEAIDWIAIFEPNYLQPLRKRRKKEKLGFISYLRLFGGQATVQPTFLAFITVLGIFGIIQFH
ncbi:MAG TPA: hypothetical protein DDY98_07350 [Ruminococcaceae bacterium]|nr:hypothetical protein [Oscillospiraceae bacterium]